MGEPPPGGQARLTTMVPRVECVRQRDAAHARDEKVDELPEVRMGGPFLQRHGYSGTSLEDIAGDLGITAPALYRHFRGKDALYTAALESNLRHRRSALQRDLPPTRWCAGSPAWRSSIPPSVCSGTPTGGVVSPIPMGRSNVRRHADAPRLKGARQHEAPPGGMPRGGADASEEDPRRYRRRIRTSGAHMDVEDSCRGVDGVDPFPGLTERGSRRPRRAPRR